ncbi:transposase [Azospirillum canadense]|uniref:transposase n=1 Tax=Azospirillum canadense TaxID=403962 RepID=UPI0022277B2B|nr:transposase [Azospirillum canadense]MCW2240799.1 transposase [Azospirillum canadense]
MTAEELVQIDPIAASISSSQPPSAGCCDDRLNPPGQLRPFIAYKAESAGTMLVAVDPRGTSQTCPDCGAVVAKTLSNRTHRCDCGCVLDRDVAAAKVILHRAVHGKGPGHGLRSPSQRVAA